MDPAELERPPPFVEVRAPCDLRCAWCNYRGTAAPAEAGELARVSARLEALAAEGHRAVGFGVLHSEPTGHPELPAMARRARALGFERVVLSTSGVAVADRAFLAALAEAGVTDVSLTVVAGEPALGDLLVGRAGGAALKLAAVEACLAEGVRLFVALALLRPTLAEVAPFARAVARLVGRASGRSAFHALLLDPVPLMPRPRLEALWPRLSELLFAMAELDAAAPGTRLHGRGLPPCVLRRLPGARAMAGAPRGATDRRERHPTLCERCAEPACPGLDPDLAALWADEGPAWQVSPAPPPRLDPAALAAALARSDPAPAALAPWASPLRETLRRLAERGDRLAGFALTDLRVEPAAIVATLASETERVVAAIEPRATTPRWFVAGERLAVSYRSGSTADTPTKRAALETLHALCEAALARLGER